MKSEAPPRARRSRPSQRRAVKGPAGPPHSPAPSRRGQPPSLRPEPPAVWEELREAIAGDFGGSPSAARGGRGPRLYLRLLVRGSGPSCQRPEAEGSGAHCRGCAMQREPGSKGPGAGVSASQSLTTKGHLKRKALSNTPHPRAYPATSSPESPRSQILLPATASHPLANACETNFSSQCKAADPVTHGAEREGGWRRSLWECGEGAAARLLFWVPLRRESPHHVGLGVPQSQA